MNADKGKHEIMDVSQYQPWVGRSEVCTDIAAPEHYRAWLSTLDYKDLTVKDGAPMPPLAHLIFNKAIVQVSEVGRDGHPKRGDFLNGTFADCLERLRGVQNGGDLVCRERFDVQQMFAIPAHGRSSTTSSCAPGTVRRTWIFSFAEVG